MLPVRYSAQATLDSSQLIAAGQLLPDCADLRVLYSDGTSFYEVDRVVEQCGAASTEVWFALQRPIAAAGQDGAYFLYYGNPSASAPPSNGMNVFLFYEDFENGMTHWTSAGGLDAGSTGTLGTATIVTEAAVSPTHSLKFSQKIGGGDAFTGFIAVTPGTGYAVSAWGRSASAAYMPVGFDAYDASHVKGAQTFFWTSEWTLGSPWTRRSATFAPAAGTAYIKLLGEWWTLGVDPVYMDNLAFRYAIPDEPTSTLGNVESTLTGPTITGVSASPVQVGSFTTVVATVAAGAGSTIDSVKLRVLSPQAVDVSMAMVSGDSSVGTWQTTFTPAQGGVYTYQILAHSNNTTSALSPVQTFTVADTLAPQITLVSVTSPIFARNLQTLTVQVIDNGLLSAVTVDLGGTLYPMTASGSQFSYSWRPTTVGTIGYTVRATDTAGNVGALSGSFVVEAREADVCTWKGCKQGAESWSDDDGNNNCSANLEAAGFRGTFYYNGTGTPSWFADYSAAGHEIGSHTVGHPCTTNACWPSCTPQNFSALCPFTPEQVSSYRQDQFEPNIAAIEAGTGKPVLTAAWPCGNNDPGRRAAADAYLVATRGYFDPDHPTNPNYGDTPWTNNVNEATPVEWQNLWAGGYYTQSHIDRAASEGKWAIIVSHGDCVGIDYMGQRKDVLWAAPVGEVAKYIRVRDAAVFSNYSRSGKTIDFDVAHNLPVFQRQTLAGASLPARDLRQPRHAEDPHPRHRHRGRRDGRRNPGHRLLRADGRGRAVRSPRCGAERVAPCRRQPGPACAHDRADYRYDPD